MNNAGVMIDFEPFKPAPWLKNAHLQTLWPFCFRRHPKPKYQRQRIELPDGDFIDLDWLACADKTRTKAITLLIHGLQGSSQSHYIRGIGKALQSANFQVAAINFRGQSGESNRLPIFGHAGHTQDIDFIVKQLKKNFPDKPITMVGVSLGASMVLNWLAKEKPNADLVHSCAVISTPFLLEQSAKRMSIGFSMVYQSYLIFSLKRSIALKLKKMPLPGILENWKQSKNFFEFDDAVTSRLHGFEDVHDYYQQASTKYKLSLIKTPLLIIQAQDDPFMSADVIPKTNEIHENTSLEIYNYGGHAGFISARRCKPIYWLDQRIVSYFNNSLNNNV